MKKIYFILTILSNTLFSQGIKVKDLPTTTTGTLNDYLIKDYYTGAAGSTQKIKVSDFILAYPTIRGDIGYTGATGMTGATGNTGAIGVTGATGTNGSIGSTGATGTIGVTGSTGNTGAIGSLGLTGRTGSTGSTGATGTNGTNGTNGSTGSTGTNGTIGVTGSTSNTGSTGSTGATGSITALGAIGSTPNANGATLTGTTLNLEPASVSFGGVITAGVQGFTGAKTFNGTTTINNTVSTVNSLNINHTVSSATANNTGIANAVTHTPAGNVNLFGIRNDLIFSGSQTLTDANQGAVGIRTSMTMTGSATITNVTGFSSANAQTGTNTITNSQGFRARNNSNSGGTVTNSFGFRADEQTGGSVINAGFYGLVSANATRWNCYMVGTAQNYFAGYIGQNVTAPLANLHVVQSVVATGQIKGLIYTGAVNTNQTATTEIPSVTFTTAGRQWATGAIALQREFLITAPTYSFVGASTISDAVTLGVTAPVAGTNATFTRSWALQATGNVAVSGNTYLGALTSASSQRLHVNGSARVTDTLYNNKVILGTSDSVLVRESNVLRYRLLSGATVANSTNSAITNDVTTNATMYPVWVTANTGNLPLKVSSTKLSFNPSTGKLTATGDATINTITVGLGSGSLAENTALGYLTLTTTTSGTNNTAVGYEAIKFITSGANNTGIGYNSLKNTNTGYGNTSIGSGALDSNTDGYQNVSVGEMSMSNNSSGYSNTALGQNSLSSNTTGYHNICIGALSGTGVTGTANKNIMIGYGSGAYETGDGKFYVGSSLNITEAASRANSLMYGVMTNSASTQTLTINGSTITNGSITNNYNLVTGTTTLNTTHYNVNLTNAGVTYAITLPTAVGITGRTYRIKQMTGTACTIATTSSQQILSIINTNVAPYTLSVGKGYIEFQSNGTDWIMNSY